MFSHEVQPRLERRRDKGVQFGLVDIRFTHSEQFGFFGRQRVVVFAGARGSR